MQTTRAPVDPWPLSTEFSATSLQKDTQGVSPAKYSLVFRPGIGSDEHLLPIHEGPWSPDGKVWFRAKISFIQDEGDAGQKETGTANNNYTASPHMNERAVEQGAGLSVTLRPEGVGQMRVRLEKEARDEMRLEDDRSKKMATVDLRLEREARVRKRAAEEAQASSRLAADVATALVGLLDKYLSKCCNKNNFSLVS